MRLAIACTLLFALASCGGPGNSLEGSIGASFSLDFDRTRIRRQDLALIIEYLKDYSGGTTKVAKVVLDTENLPMRGGAVVKGDVFVDRVQVSRVATSGGDFPPLKSGSIRFEDWEFSDGGRVSGEFDVLFTNGRTLHGNFENTVEVVPAD